MSKVKGAKNGTKVQLFHPYAKSGMMDATKLNMTETETKFDSQRMV